MKCKNCGKENLIKAQYCQDCGQPFTDQERQTAYDQTFWGKLDKLKKAKEIVEDTKSLPRTVLTVIDEHPSDARKMLQPVREALEALGAVFDEDYNYGYYD